MKTTITSAGEFLRAVEVEAIAAVPGSYRVQFFSQHRSSRNPDEWQNNFALVLQKRDLQTLSNLIASVL